MANMENTTDNSAAETTDVTASELVGSALQVGREVKNMTVEDAARQLRLSTHQILALEQDNFAKLPNAMITRGFIRNYARLLDIDAVPLLQAYRVKMPDTGQSKLSLTSERIVIKNTKKKSYQAYLLIGLVLMLGLAAWWFYTDENKAKIASMTNQVMDENASEMPAAQDASTEALPPQALPAAERLAEANSAVTPPAVDASTVQLPTKPEAAKPEIVALAKPDVTKPEIVKPEITKPEITKLEVVKPGNESIKLKATEETWVQVRNTAGDVIYERTIAAGGIDNFDFKPPAKVVVGNASGAQLFYKNQPIDLLSRAKNNVARITLE